MNWLAILSPEVAKVAGLAFLLSFCVVDLQAMLKMWKRPLIIDTTKSQEELGLAYHDVDQTLIDTAYCLINSGEVPQKGGKKAGGSETEKTQEMV